VTLPIWTSNAPGQFGQKTLDRRYNRYRFAAFPHAAACQPFVRGGGLG
jgi:hypothetical protein